MIGAGRTLRRGVDALGRAARGPTLVTVVTDVARDPDGRVDVARLAAGLAPADVLESAPGTGWSHVLPDLAGAGHPDTERLIDDGSRTVLVAPGAAPRDLGPDPFAALEAAAARLCIHPDAEVDPVAPPVGGLVGALAYDLAHRSGGPLGPIGDAPPLDRSGPQLWLRRVGTVVTVPPTRDEVIVVTLPAATLGDADAAHALTVSRVTATATAPVPLATAPVPHAARTSLPRRAHRAAVSAVIERIAAGDVYQVNVTQRLTADWPADVAALARALVAASPASHAALLPELGLASISPESFLEVRGRRVRTRPIKGTRPRSEDADLDAALADDLATAPKDRAENVMVVDLERNDLGRVCVPGSIRVTDLARVEAHPTVWHLVSTVEGELRAGVGYGTLLAATFPSGSVTGAPKLAAMRLIAALEPVRRGWYCGAVGYLAPGAAHLSVAIRTATLAPDGRVDYGAGGGIVADSDPDAEVAESLDKAAAFLRAVGATHVVPDPEGAR